MLTGGGDYGFDQSVSTDTADLIPSVSGLILLSHEQWSTVETHEVDVRFRDVLVIGVGTVMGHGAMAKRLAASDVRL
jgi:hypothetical protein